MKSTSRITQRTTLLAILIIALFGSSSFAHTYLSSVTLNGVALNEGDCVRPHPDQEKEYPIPLVTSADMRCGWLPAANNPANRKCPIAAGSKIGVQWHHNSNSASDDILERTHKGPIQYFLAKSESGAGDVWFKIYEDGLSGGQWATDRLVDANGKMEVTIPADIAPGNYLLRGEILALHNAYAVNGIQPYVGCVELTISGSGSATPSGVSFPGFYTNTGPGMLFDVYSSYSSYTIPGPALYKSGSSPSSTSSPTTKPTPPPNTQPSSTTSRSTNTPTAPPTYTPTVAPSSGSITLQLNGGSNEYWVGVIVRGGSETVVKVEISSSGSQSWTALVDMSYAYIYSGAKLNLPLSVRVTSSSGKTITATNIFTLFTTTDVIDTGKTFSSPTTPTNAPTSTPTQPPSTPTTRPSSPPTYSPTTKPTSTPSPTAPTDSVKITQLSGVSKWWFAVTLSGNSRGITKVELKDSDTLSSYVSMSSNSWGWAYPTQGSPLVTPLTLRLTSETGKTITATINSIDSGLIFSSNDSL